MSTMPSWKGVRVYTVGHSTRALVDFIGLLKAFAISVVVDIRTIPQSRHNQQFNRHSLRPSLEACDLRYVHIPELGGLRRPRRDSPNGAWQNASFRGFADYALTAEEFEAGIAKLRALTADGTVALMCAEAVPWRCHRSLIADVLTSRGAHVEHIMSRDRANQHRVKPFARNEGTHVVYPETAPEKGPSPTRLLTRAPFHLEATVRALQRRPTNLVDVWEDERYIRVLKLPDALVTAEVANRGTIDGPELWLTLHGEPSPTARAALERAVRRILGLDVDPEPLRRIAEAVPSLRPAALALRGMRPPRFAGLFEAFANVVPFQQVSLDAGVAIVGRFVERFGAVVQEGGRRLHAFPSASAVAHAHVDALTACGLSLRKAETVQRAARAIASGTLSEEQLASASTEDATRTLVALNGIGPWSAGVILLRGLGRLDVFPPGDVGAMRGLARLMDLPAGSSLDRVVERFGDHRGYLYFFALGESLRSRGLIHAAPPPRGARRSA